MPASRFATHFIGIALLVIGIVAIGLGPKASNAANETATTKSGALSLLGGSDEVTALFHVSSDLPSLLTSGNRNSNWQLFSRTQLAYLHSHFVLQSALRAEGVSQLPLVQAQSDPVAWLNSQLNVGFYQNSEILYVTMRGTPADKPQLRTIVNAVCDAYLKEAVFEEDQRRLVLRDALQRSYHGLSEEIRKKTDAQYSLARELGFAGTDGSARVMQELDLKRLERIEAKLLRLEDEQLAAKIYSEQEGVKTSPKERAQLSFYEQRIEELRKRQAELETKIGSRNQSSVELEIGSNELKQLQTIAGDMSLKLEQMDVEAVAPDRIRMIQKAQ